MTSINGLGSNIPSGNAGDASGPSRAKAIALEALLLYEQEQSGNGALSPNPVIQHQPLPNLGAYAAELRKWCGSDALSLSNVFQILGILINEQQKGLITTNKINLVESEAQIAEEKQNAAEQAREIGGEERSAVNALGAACCSAVLAGLFQAVGGYLLMRSAGAGNGLDARMMIGGNVLQGMSQGIGQISTTAEQDYDINNPDGGQNQSNQAKIIMAELQAENTSYSSTVQSTAQEAAAIEQEITQALAAVLTLAQSQASLAQAIAQI